MKGEKTMPLLTPELRHQLPRLYQQEGNNNPMVYMKLFLPGTDWTWYITEGQPEDDDFILYGYTFGQDGEWGYISLNELESLCNRLGLPVERDEYFIQAPWQEIKQRHYQERGMKK
jgi:hypothetical protein